ncbi:MAG: preprotein translocase subunit YajC [Bacteriovoracaceae bacterium]|nr:preprotein translocase subunit YajC [Bacteriovoracaceae bacterium]
MMNLFISNAYAQAAGAQAQNPLMSMVPFVLVFVVMYFFMIRPQKKKMQEEQNFLSKLAHGEEVFTKSGILGKISGITEKVVTLELEGGTKMKVLKTHIGGSSKAVLAEGTK